jgi:hypothetical protein
MTDILDDLNVASLDPKLRNAITRAVARWEDIDVAISNGQRTLLWGPPGTGKSYAGLTNLVGPALDQGVNRLYITMDTPSAEIRGHYVPTKGGGFQWHDGPATNAWRTGSRLAIEEIDAASGDCLTLLLGFLDDPESAVLTLPSNETIRPANGFSAVATTNQLPQVIPPALLDRFDAVLHVELPNPRAFGGKWHSDKLRDAALNVLYLRSAEQNGIRGADGRDIGLRAFRSIDRYIGRGVTLQKACEIVIGKDAGQWLAVACSLSEAKA